MKATMRERIRGSILLRAALVAGMLAVPTGCSVLADLSGLEGLHDPYAGPPTAPITGGAAQSSSAAPARAQPQAQVQTQTQAQPQAQAQAQPQSQPQAQAQAQAQAQSAGSIASAPDTTSVEADVGEQPLAEGLAPDKSSAQYSDETLTNESTAPAPAPPPTKAGAASAAAATASSAAAPTSSMDELAAVPQEAPAPELAVPEAAPESAPAETAAPTSMEAAPPSPARVATAPAAPPPQPAAQPQVSEGGSVVVDLGALDSAAGGSPGSYLRPSGDSRPFALIYFPMNSSAVTGESMSVLGQVAGAHREHGGLVRIIGYASNEQGSGDPVKQKVANLTVSLARANAVARALVKLGVPADQLSVAAAGDAPAYVAGGITGDDANRRAEIYFDY